MSFIRMDNMLPHHNINILLSSLDQGRLLLMRNSYSFTRAQETEDMGLLVSLQKNLLEVWEESKVEEYYQNIILTYLDTLPSSQAKEQITKEIKDTHQGRSPYFKLIQKLNERKKSLLTLQNLIGNGNQRGKANNQLMGGICQLLKSLRDDNLIVAQTLIQLHKHYTKDDDEVSDECKAMLINLDEQNSFLKDSFLNQFILFQHGYDPFFLHHFDMKGKRAPTNSSPLIDRLFSLSISYACRLFKAKNQILQMLSSGKFQFSDLNNKKQSPVGPFTTIIPKQTNNNGGKIRTQNHNFDQKKQTSSNFRTKTLSLHNAKQKEKIQSNRPNSISNRYQTLNNSQIGSPNLSKDKLKYAFKNKQQQIRPSTRNGGGKMRSRHIKKEEANDVDYSNQPQDQQQDLVLQSRKPSRQQQNKQQADSQNQKYVKLVPLYRIKKGRSLIKSQKQEIKRKKIQTYENYQSEEIQQKKSNNFRYKLQPIQTPHRRKFFKPKQESKESQLEVKPSPVFRRSKRTIDKNESPLIEAQPNKSISMTPKLSKQSLLLSGKLDFSGQNSSPSRKQIKIKPGKCDHFQLINYLKSLKINEQLRKSTILNLKWCLSLSKCQTYLCQFYINNELAVSILTMLLPDGNYLIKLWAPTQACDEQTSILLFRKFIDYLEKMTSAKEIYYNGDQTVQIISCQFGLKKERLYFRQRISALTKKNQPFPPFLSLKCSNIHFSQDSAVGLLYSEQIEAFSDINSYIAPQVANITKQLMNNNLLMLTKINSQIFDMKTLNSLLVDQQFDTYEVTSSLKINNISALRISIHSHFKLPFIAGEGYLKFSGQEVFKNQNSALLRINGQKNNTKMYFGRGFSTIKQFILNIKKQCKGLCEFSVKMFNKQLYGRIPNEGVLNGCYGNCQISLYWQDQLQGRVKHNMTICEHFGPESFFVGIEIESELVYCFQVKQQDFLF